MDGIVFKVRDNGKIINKTVYLCAGLKEVLGMWVGKSESSSFWMGVLTDLKARGVQDILITCTDNLNGFTDTIRTVFPLSSTQICVVHQIRNSCKYVVYKDKKEFTADMKNIYNAPNKEVAATELDNLERKWGAKYPYAIRSWRNNWEDLCEFGIRRIKKVQVVVYSPYVQVMAAAYPQKSNMQQALSINSL